MANTTKAPTGVGGTAPAHLEGRMRFIGHCRRCKLTRRFEAIEFSMKPLSLDYGRKGWRREWDVSQAAPFKAVSTHAVEHHDRAGTFWLKCPAGHSVEFKLMRGRVSEKPCGPRCLSATGPNCECACGGEHHGDAHAGVL